MIDNDVMALRCEKASELVEGIEYQAQRCAIAPTPERMAALTALCRRLTDILAEEDHDWWRQRTHASPFAPVFDPELRGGYC